MAVFGAPADDPDHAANAARAALDCCTQLAELNASSAFFRENKLAQRIGINSGEALVGNFGSQRRFNYSVMSDAVNLASRLEGANKFYGTTIIASETTVALAGDDFAWRELDAIRVKGRTQALKIYELVALSAALTSSQQALIASYAGGLAHWRAREFEQAATSFGRSADNDRPASLFCKRARELAKTRRVRIGIRSGRCRRNDAETNNRPAPWLPVTSTAFNNRCRSSGRIACHTRRHSNHGPIGSRGRIDRADNRAMRRTGLVAQSCA